MQRFSSIYVVTTCIPIRLGEISFCVEYHTIKEMLIVSDTKLRQVKDAIENWISGVIVLRGPSGSGKHTSLFHVCSELGMSAVSHCPEEGYDFVSVALRLNSCASGKTLLMSRDSKILRVVVDNCGSFPNVLPAFVMDEDDLSYRNQSGILVISVNAFSDTAIRKLVGSMVDENFADVEAVVAASGGDARQAIRELQIRGAYSENHSVVPLVPRRKRKKIEDITVHGVCGKDNSFSLFHTIGKILYNKKGAATDCDKLVAQPVVSGSGDVAILTIHENIPDFVYDIERLVRISQNFSFADTGFKTFATTESRDLFVFKSIACLNTREEVIDAPNSFRAFRKSPLNECRNRQKVSMQHLSFLKEVRGDFRVLHLLDVLLRATNGIEPTNLRPVGKRAVFNLLHSADNTELVGEPIVEPKELEDDPIEDC